jgi:two-component system, response regulator YesN
VVRPVNPHVLLALRTIELRYREPDVSVRAVAATLGISVEHLCRVFKHQTGLTVRSHLLNTRLTAARRLLETTTLSVKQVAGQTGFRDSSHLDHVFRRAFGVSPRRHRLEALGLRSINRRQQISNGDNRLHGSQP